MTQTPMIEKMARAIMAANTNNAHDLARAALSALEEPSEAMIEAGTARMGQAFLHVAPHAIVAQHTFAAMIKAIQEGE